MIMRIKLLVNLHVQSFISIRRCFIFKNMNNDHVRNLGHMFYDRKVMLLVFFDRVDERA